MRGGGVALKSLSLVFRVLEFCSAAAILGIFSYFLANLHSNHRSIPTWEKAVEGISGAAVLYTIFAFLLVCCLGGVAFFSFLAILLDLAFAGAFIYIAWATRNGVRGKTGVICTPLGCGAAKTKVTDSVIEYITAHRLETAVFAISIIGVILFFLNMFIEFGLMRHHKKEKAFGPSPNNGYTAGSPRRKFWQRKQSPRDMELGAGKVHPDALPPHTVPADVAVTDTRPSYATDSTAVADHVPESKYGHSTPIGTAHTGNAPYGTTQMPAGNYHNSNGTF